METRAAENRNSNSKMEDESDNCTDIKVSIDEAVISGGFINKESYNTENKQRSVHNCVGVTDININDPTVVGCIKEELCDTGYDPASIPNFVRIKEENIDDLDVRIPENEIKTDCTEDKLCSNETAISGGYIKVEPCGVKDEQETIPDYLSIKDESMDDLTVVPQETEFMSDCMDNKVSVYQTIISGGYIKEEPCDMKDEPGSNHSNIDMKGCEECGQMYDLYCLQCPMLIRIFDGNNPDGTDDAFRRTLPKNLIEICESQSGVGIVAARAIPQAVVFGPFEGVDSTKDGAISKWRLRNKELVLAEDPDRLNWMQYIRRTDKNSHRNLEPFQYEDRLYYRSECHINAGDELLVHWDSDDEEGEIQDVKESYWEPPICESFDDSYACTFCCVGYKSISHLKAHNFTCFEKRDKKGFCKGIVQCDVCKIYLDEKEFSDYHMGRCHKGDAKCVFNARYRRKLGRPLRYRINYDDKSFSCILCPYKATTKLILEQHIAVHNGDKPFSCPVCPHKATTKSNLKQHIAIHNGDKTFACSLCPYKATRKSHLKQHVVVHNDGKPFACSLCSYTARTKSNLKQHMAVHNDDEPFTCTLCPYKAKKRLNLKRHINVHNEDNAFSCTLCSYKTKTMLNLKRHIVVHKDDRPFTCSLCSYKTARKSDLKQHFAIHIANRPFACTHCPYKATTKSNLKQHVVTHNGEKPFACALCLYKTKTKSRLKKHMAVHNGGKP